MLTRRQRNAWAAAPRDHSPALLENGTKAERDSAVAKAAAAMTRLRRSRQLRGPKTDRKITRTLSRQRFAGRRTPNAPSRGHARPDGTGHSVLVWADRPGHGEGLWLMRGTVVVSCPRLSHWYGGLGR